VRHRCIDVTRASRFLLQSKYKSTCNKNTAVNYDAFTVLKYYIFYKLISNVLVDFETTDDWGQKLRSNFAFLIVKLVKGLLKCLSQFVVLDLDIGPNLIMKYRMQKGKLAKPATLEISEVQPTHYTVHTQKF